jgi:hypothetical protein
VSLAPGENRIEVRVRDREERSGTRERIVTYRLREPKDAAEARRFDEERKLLLQRTRARTVEAELVREIARSREGTQGRELELRAGPEKETPSDAR